MKIILKHKYNGGTKTFENKNEMVDYVNNYIAENIGERKLNYNKYNIYDIVYKYFADWNIERVK